MQLIRSLVTSLRHSLGEPVMLREYIEAHADMIRMPLPPQRTADGTLVEHWHNWHAESWDWQAASWMDGARHQARVAPGTLRGWALQDEGYRGTQIQRSDLAHLCMTNVIPRWSGDIRDVEMLTASKGPLAEHSDLDAFARECAPHLSSPGTVDQLEAVLRHREIRIVNNQERTCDHFSRSMWDGRVVLHNSGGSHHFAAARLIAAQCNAPVPLQGRMYEHTLSSASVTSMHRDFATFAIRTAPGGFAYGRMHESLAAIRAPYFVHTLPAPYSSDGLAILLPRSDPRAAAAAEVFRDANMTDVGEHLKQLVRQQNALRCGVPAARVDALARPSTSLPSSPALYVPPSAEPSLTAVVGAAAGLPKRLLAVDSSNERADDSPSP